MKKLIYIFGIAALMLAAGCSKDDGWNIPNGIKPVKPSKELTAFFDENLRFIGLSIFGKDNEASLRGGGRYPDTCIMINSVAEFEAIDFSAGTSLELPPIDFTKYTLVIGQYATPSHGDRFEGQRIVVEPEEITMNLLFISSGDRTHDMWKKEYWGLYPKLPDLPIRVVRQSR